VGNPLATARYGLQDGSIGTASATLGIGGTPVPAAGAATEEWTRSLAVKTVTVS